MYFIKFSGFVIITLSSHLISSVYPIKYNVVQKLSAFQGDKLILEEETSNVGPAKDVSETPEKGYRKIFQNLWPFQDIKQAQEELTKDMKNEIDKENEISNDLSDEGLLVENERDRRSDFLKDGKKDKEIVYNKIKTSLLDGLKNGLKRIQDSFSQFFG